jgi:hypothetical protein
MRVAALQAFRFSGGLPIFPGRVALAMAGHRRQGMHIIIERLRNLSERCRRSTDAEFQWLGGALDRFVNHRCRSLEEAFGLRFARGGMPWWREEATRKRDTALRALTQRYYPNHRPAERVKRIYELTVRYGASAWRWDALRQAMPPQYTGTANEWLWKAFASGAPMPIRERRLRDILQGIDTHQQLLRPQHSPADRIAP